jgi:hypothetical protein
MYVEGERRCLDVGDCPSRLRPMPLLLLALIPPLGLPQSAAFHPAADQTSFPTPISGTNCHLALQYLHLRR